ncbi:hypothetical protein PENSPDRAFT_672736 [Peniophora sp. CONT]|nr:hypothetical protein PENSPDRAFT_672736 [Peniophora sp. CONT]
MHFSLECPIIKVAAIEPHIGICCPPRTIIRERVDRQIRRLNHIGPILCGFMKGPVTLTVQTNIFPPGSQVDVTFMARDGHSKAEISPISIGTTYSQPFCSQLAKHKLQYTTAYLLCAFSWSTIRVIRVDVNITYNPRLTWGKNSVCRERLRDCFVPDPLHISTEEDRALLQTQLRQMKEVYELDILMVRSWENIGLGLFEALLLCSGDELLLPRLQVIRLSAPPRWHSVRIGHGIWWSQLCNVVKQRQSGEAVRIELVGNFRICF